MILTRRHLSPIAAGVAIALLTSSAAYFWAGERAWRGAGEEQAARTWPTVEMFRLTNATGLIHKTPADLAALGGIAPGRIDAWLALEADAERCGVWMAAAVGLATILLVLSIFIIADWFYQHRDVRRLKRTATKLAPPTPLTIGSIPIPADLETRHILLLGSTGTGKSQVIRGIVRAARARGVAIVAVDRGCDLLSQFYKNGDLIINCFDRRSKLLSPLSNARDATTIEHYSSALFNTDGLKGSEQYFIEAAKLIYIQILTSLKDGTNADLWAVFCDRERLAAALKSTPAEQYLHNREWPSIFSTLFNRVRDLAYLPAEATARNSFSIRLFAEQADGRARGRAVWIAMPHQQSAALSQMAASMMSIVTNAVQSLPETNALRLLAVTDEIGNLPRLGGFESALSEGRKFGLSVLSAAQTDAQLAEKYGSNGSKILKSCFTTKVFFRTEDADGAEASSRILSDIEVLEQTRSTTESATGGSSSESERRVSKRAVPAAEFLNLPDLTAYIKLGPYGHAKITVPIVNSPTQASAFVPRQPGDPLSVADARQRVANPAAESSGSPVQGLALPIKSAGSASSHPALDLTTLAEIAGDTPAADFPTE